VHPVFSQHGRLHIYLAAWIPVAALLAGLLAASQARTGVEAVALGLPLAMNAAFFSLALWPLCKAMPLRGDRAVTLAITHLVAALLTSSVWLLFGAGWAGALEYGARVTGAFARFRADVPLLLVVGSLLFILSSTVNYLILAFEATREAERAALELKIHARDAELRALRAQLNPHFLFNSLNAIGALAGSDAAGARRMCSLLSEFLRRTLVRGAERELPLAEEVDLADAYLGIEEVRFGDRLRVEHDVETSALDCRVPSLLLQPLVENAIAHGIAAVVEGGVIHIRARERGGRLEIEIDNPFDAEAPRRPGHGVGLGNVRERLAARHPGQSRVEARSNGDRYQVTLSLPAVRA
jgi:signal transduction histidine kinase